MRYTSRDAKTYYPKSFRDERDQKSLVFGGIIFDNDTPVFATQSAHFRHLPPQISHQNVKKPTPVFALQMYFAIARDDNITHIFIIARRKSPDKRKLLIPKIPHRHTAKTRCGRIKHQNRP